ncbi:MAG: thymidine kinase [Patescibacteria group bacterium]|nr:thymidine kinase [Patescibacteria group bacterium]
MIGTIEVITGCMFSGKTNELQRRKKLAEIAKQEVIIIKPSRDDRDSGEVIASHDGNEIQAEIIDYKNPEPILSLIGENTRVVAIDEAQFFEEKIVNVILHLAYDKGLRIIVSGLNQDFKGKPFGSMPVILALADKVDNLIAICIKCGKLNATKTQRIIDGKPAHYSSPTILTGREEFYEARCVDHHVVPGRPLFLKKRK